MSKPSTIAIDGPVASGKSTIGRLIAQRLGYRFIDTGAMYRAITWQAIRLNVDPQDEDALHQLAAETKIEFRDSSNDDAKVTVNGRDVTEELRNEEVERDVSIVSKAAKVRQVLVQEQQSLAQVGKIVMAGRDIGTTVLPKADLKVYLNASVEERARRRYMEIKESGDEADHDSILADLVRRDEIDSKRAVSPLQPASDARLLDTNALSIEQVVLKIMDMVGEG